MMASLRLVREGIDGEFSLELLGSVEIYLMSLGINFERKRFVPWDLPTGQRPYRCHRFLARASVS